MSTRTGADLDYLECRTERTGDLPDEARLLDDAMTSNVLRPKQAQRVLDPDPETDPRLS